MATVPSYFRTDDGNATEVMGSFEFSEKLEILVDDGSYCKLKSVLI